MALNHVRTFGDVSRKEDVVLNAIEILTARETQIFNMLGKTEAIDTVHHYLTDTLDAAALNAQKEADDYTMGSRTVPSRSTNLIQHIFKPFAVSDTQRDVSHYHGKDELQRQTEKALMEWGNDAEFNILRSTLTSGASGTAPAMSGILQGISTSLNYTAHNSGTAWSASILDGLVKNNYENSNGDMATDLFMNSTLRAATDAFTQKTNTIVNGPAVSTIVRTVSYYQTAFSTLAIHTHRYIYQSDTTTRLRVLGINRDKLKVAFLRRPWIDMNIARTGPSTKRSVNGSLTVEIRNKNSNFYADGFSS